MVGNLIPHHLELCLFLDGKDTNNCQDHIANQVFAKGEGVKMDRVRAIVLGFDLGPYRDHRVATF